MLNNHDNKPEIGRSNSRAVTRFGVLATSVIVGTALGSGTVGNITDRQRVDKFEAEAEASAEKTFDTLKFDDIAQVRLVKAKAGPTVLYNNREEPSLQLKIKTGPGLEYDSQWVQDGGDSTGDYHAEIMWMGAGVEAHYTDVDGEDLIDGVTYGSFDKDATQEDLNFALFGDNIDYGREGTYFITVPFNRTKQGERTLELTPALYGYHLFENGELPTDDEAVNTLEGEPLLTLDVNIVGEQVYLDGVPLEVFSHHGKPSN